MQPYPSELKEVVLERVLSGEISLNVAPQTDKSGFAAVRKWRDNALTFNMPASLAPYYGLGKGTLQTQKVDCRCALMQRKALEYESASSVGQLSQTYPFGKWVSTVTSVRAKGSFP